MSSTSHEILRSLIRFGGVGIAAVVTQAFVFILLARYAGWSGFTANTTAFSISVLVSYLGQSRLTFADRAKRSISKFLLIAIVSFSLGSGSAWLVVDHLGYSPYWMMPVILVAIPLISFAMMHRWVFTNERE